ncbi:MAG: hypothetical protein P4L40_15610 [Terracidiphilus sp.]|nr:hypothetical protein [Terracidiphilus sp.]
MKCWRWIAILLLAAVPAFGAKKITVAELKDTLVEMQKANKGDTDVSNALKQVELSEQLTRATMNSLVSYVPGPLSTEQIYVLEARSALMVPPTSDLPATPAPDASAQKALLDKAATYVTGTYNQLPALTATKTTVRFQDHFEATAAASGMSGGAKDASVGSAIVSPYQFIHYINSTESQVASEHGAEKSFADKDKTPWGANRMIQLMEPDPDLGQVFAEAQAVGDIKWLRWEAVNGKPAAVYTFTVPKKKAHMALNVCCFPDVEQAGKAQFTSASGFGTGQPGGSAGAAGGAKGNFQTSTTWHNYKANVPYHGSFYIDADTGIVVRLIVEEELKPSEVVHQVATRIDYAPASIGGKMAVVPMRTVVDTVVVPNGDSGAAGAYAERRTLFTSEYKNYAAATK